MSERYLSPDGPGKWLSAKQAKDRILRLAARYDKLEQHDRATYTKRAWRAIAARPDMWREWEGLAAAWEASSEATAQSTVVRIK